MCVITTTSTKEAHGSPGPEFVVPSPAPLPHVDVRNRHQVFSSITHLLEIGSLGEPGVQLQPASPGDLPATSSHRAGIVNLGVAIPGVFLFFLWYGESELRSSGLCNECSYTEAVFSKPRVQDYYWGMVTGTVCLACSQTAGSQEKSWCLASTTLCMGMV